MISPRTASVLLLPLLALHPIAHSQQPQTQPSIRTYKTIGATQLKAHIFMPAAPAKGKLHPAIILLHGGGWTVGSPEWTYDDAKWYANMGLVAVAGEYRLTDHKSITPLEAMADTRDLIRWVRQNAADLGVDPHRVAVYGVSAGGQLAASAAVFPHEDESKVSAIPDALLLLSPAVSIADAHEVQLLLGTRAEVKDISPAENIKKPLPPMIIIGGAADTLVTAAGLQRFCEEAKQIGGTCEIHLYPGLGHILSRNLDPHAQAEGPFDPDPTAVSDSHIKYKAFLVQLGYIK